MVNVFSARFVQGFCRLMIGICALSLTTTACKSKKKNNPPPTPEVQAPQPIAPSPAPSSTPAANQQAPAPKIVGTSANNPNLQYQANQTVRMQLGVEGTNVAANQYEFSLARMPVGATLTNRSGANPELVWNAAADGTYDIQVVARNMPECQRVLGPQAACSIPTSQFGRITPDSRFDLVQSFQIKVGTGVANSGNYSNGNYNYGNGDQGYAGGKTGRGNYCYSNCGCN